MDVCVEKRKLGEGTPTWSSVDSDYGKGITLVQPGFQGPHKVQEERCISMCGRKMYLQMC